MFIPKTSHAVSFACDLCFQKGVLSQLPMALDEVVTLHQKDAITTSILLINGGFDKFPQPRRAQYVSSFLLLAILSRACSTHSNPL